MLPTTTLPATDEHREPIEPLAPDLVLDIARGLARARPLWDGAVRHHGEERHAVRLLVHERYEAWLIGWPPGHRTTPHDHGGAIGALAVVDGTLLERSGGRPDERRLDAGSLAFLPEGLVHDVGTTPDAIATSIHVYSPPLSTMTFYEDGSGLPDHVLDVGDETALLDARLISQALHPSATPTAGADREVTRG